MLRKDKFKWTLLSLLVIIGVLFLSLLFRGLCTSLTVARTATSLNDFAINQKFLSLSIECKISDIEKTWAGRLGLMEMRHSSVAIIGAGKNVAEHLPSILKQVDHIILYKF